MESQRQAPRSLRIMVLRPLQVRHSQVSTIGIANRTTSTPGCRTLPVLSSMRLQARQSDELSRNRSGVRTGCRGFLVASAAPISVSQAAEIEPIPSRCGPIPS
eukprot:3790912-Rhodomonas_salina.2